MAISDRALALLLAGGVGSRLNILVQSRAKPAVRFAGIYRIIDFTLSNVMNSGLNRVGVMTQYKPLSLMRHIGTGEAWDFIGRSRGAEILPPRTGAKDSDWYKGTADAVRQNIDFITAHPSREVLILSGDHIYQMDYDAMIHFHRHKGADLTVAMMVVPREQIHQFGAGITDQDGRIVEWEEKPKEPRTNLASMGIYVFNTDYLLDLLAADRNETDFGMHLLPRAIANHRVYAYPFYGYWRDVGTIQAYWQANMDVLDPQSGLDPEGWGVRPNPYADARPYDQPPARYLAGSSVEDSFVAAGCVIEGRVERSILSPGVRVGRGAVVRDSIIGDDTVIGVHSLVDLAILDKRVRVAEGARIGVGPAAEAPVNRRYPQHLYTGITLVGKGAEITAGCAVGRNCIVRPGVCGWPAELASGETI